MLVTKINLVKWLEKKGSWKSAIAGSVPVRMQRIGVSAKLTSNELNSLDPTRLDL